ncbi:MAG TPA: hypothetical protein VL921_00330, partial [Candidatus Udaeobacter sp.]|nr:hypothetical protein [Candidatus Udaeobacter sp.]
GAITMQKMTDLVRKRIPEMIMSKPDVFDGLWDSFQKELEQAGVHELEQQFEGLLKERIELFNE